MCLLLEAPRCPGAAGGGGGGGGVCRESPAADLSVKARAVMDGTYGDDECVRHAWNSTMLPLKSQECKESICAQKDVEPDETCVAFLLYSAPISAAALKAAVCPPHSAGIQILTECCI